MDYERFLSELSPMGRKRLKLIQHQFREEERVRKKRAALKRKFGTSVLNEIWAKELIEKTLPPGFILRCQHPKMTCIRQGYSYNVVPDFGILNPLGELIAVFEVGQLSHPDKLQMLSDTLPGVKIFYIPEPEKWKYLWDPNKMRRAAYQRHFRAANSEKIRERERRRYASNPEKRKELSHTYYMKNREKEIARSRRYDALNPAKARSRQRRWHREHPGKIIKFD